MKSIYTETPEASSGERALREAVKQVQESPETLKAWARIIARYVYSGALDSGEAWDALFLAATFGGLEQLQAQQLIGEGFATARLSMIGEAVSA